MKVLSLGLTSGQLNEFFHKTWSPEKLLNHEEVDYLFMSNFHGVEQPGCSEPLFGAISENVRRTCQEDKNDTKN